MVGLNVKVTKGALDEEGGGKGKEKEEVIVSLYSRK